MQQNSKKTFIISIDSFGLERWEIQGLIHAVSCLKATIFVQTKAPLTYFYCEVIMCGQPSLLCKVFLSTSSFRLSLVLQIRIWVAFIILSLSPTLLYSKIFYQLIWGYPFSTYARFSKKLTKILLTYCVCVCSFPFTVKASPNRTKQLILEAQISDGMLRKFFCAKYLCLHVIDNHSRNLQASICAKECQLNREEPQEVKGNSYKLCKTNSKSAKHSYLPPH